MRRLFVMILAFVATVSAHAEIINPIGSAYSCMIDVTGFAVRMDCGSPTYGVDRPNMARRAVMISNHGIAMGPAGPIDTPPLTLYCGGPNVCEEGDELCEEPLGIPIPPKASARFDGLDRVIYCTVGGGFNQEFDWPVYVTETFADSATASGDMMIFAEETTAVADQGLSNDDPTEAWSAQLALEDTWVSSTNPLPIFMHGVERGTDSPEIVSVCELGEDPGYYAGAMQIFIWNPYEGESGALVTLATDSDGRLPVTAHSTGTQTVTGTVAATQSGVWSTRLQDGAGTGITSRSDGGRQDLHVFDLALDAKLPALDGDGRLPVTAHSTGTVASTQSGAWTIDTSETCVPNLYDNPTVLAACDAGGTITASLDAGRYAFNVTGEATYFRLGVAALATGGTLYVPGTQQVIQIAADATNIACRSPGAGGTIEVIPCL